MSSRDRVARSGDEVAVSEVAPMRSAHSMAFSPINRSVLHLLGVATALILSFAWPMPEVVAGPGKTQETKKSGKTKTPEDARKKPAPKEPDPLEGAWPDAKGAQLGNGSLRSEVLVAAQRLKGMK